MQIGITSANSLFSPWTLPYHVVMKNLVGQQFGMWTVTSFAFLRSGAYYWNLRCQCGVERAVSIAALVRGSSRSCGCSRILAGFASRKVRKEPEFKTWDSMIYRCHNASCHAFSRYGGRGITVCDRWRTSYHNFLADMGRRPSLKHTLDRIDNGGNYEPGNCRWATKLEQARNRANSVIVEFDGRKQTLPDWAEELGLSYQTIMQRFRRGLPIDRVLAHGRLSRWNR